MTPPARVRKPLERWLGSWDWKLRPIGALSFFPALALGPLAEFFGSIA